MSSLTEYVQVVRGMAADAAAISAADAADRLPAVSLLIAPDMPEEMARNIGINPDESETYGVGMRFDATDNFYSDGRNVKEFREFCRGIQDQGEALDPDAIGFAFPMIGEDGSESYIAGIADRRAESVAVLLAEVARIDGCPPVVGKFYVSDHVELIAMVGSILLNEEPI